MNYFLKLSYSYQKSEIIGESWTTIWMHKFLTHCLLENFGGYQMTLSFPGAYGGLNAKNAGTLMASRLQGPSPILQSCQQLPILLTEGQSSNCVPCLTPSHMRFPLLEIHVACYLEHIISYISGMGYTFCLISIFRYLSSELYPFR